MPLFFTLYHFQLALFLLINKKIIVLVETASYKAGFKRMRSQGQLQI